MRTAGAMLAKIACRTTHKTFCQPEQLWYPAKANTHTYISRFNSYMQWNGMCCRTHGDLGGVNLIARSCVHGDLDNREAVQRRVRAREALPVGEIERRGRRDGSDKRKRGKDGDRNGGAGHGDH